MINPIEVIPICALKDNYIWMLKDKNSNNAWIVDPGDSRPVINALKTNNICLKGILITHHHYDHTDGLKDLNKLIPNLKIYGSDKSEVPEINCKLKDNDEFTIFDIKFKAIAVPGHTLDHTAFHGNNCLFSGDTLFSFGCGRIFEGTPEQMLNSLNKLKALPDDTKLYCGHEYTLNNLKFTKLVDPDNNELTSKIEFAENQAMVNEPTLPSLLADEKKLNPFLRCEENAIKSSVEKYANITLNNEVEVFTKLRDWKNCF